MRETKLFLALAQLSGHEINKLHRFILSPYFNQSEPLTRLFEWLKEDIKSKNQKEPSKEDAWRKCVGNDEPYEDSRFRKFQSDLLKLIESYFAQEAFESNPIYKAKFLLESIKEKDLTILKSSALKTTQKLIKEQHLNHAAFYLFQYEIEQIIYEVNRHDIERSAKSNIENIALNLDRFYLAEKLRYYCTILNHQHLTSQNYKMLFIDEIIEHVKLHEYQDVPPIIMYYQILLTYNEPNESKHYIQLKKLITHNIHLFPESQAKEIIDAALNYCIKKMNAGQEEYVREAFNLYLQSLDSGILLVKGQLTPWSFKNIVTIGLRLKEFDLIENFINIQSNLLDSKYRNNAVTFNLAQLHFYKKDYEKVIKLLSKVEYDDMTYNLNSKTLLMASYYELDEIEALGSLLDTFRVYLSRNKELPATRRKHYLNTITIVRKLSRIAHGDMAAIAKLQKDVENTQGVVSKNWILEKLAHLQSSLV